MRTLRAVTLSALLLAACSGGGEDEVSLEDGIWGATGVVDESGTMAPVLEGTTPSARFTGTEVGGDASCNSYNGGYTTTGTDGLTIGPLQSTAMFCAGPEGLMDQERAFLVSLGMADSYAIEERTLTLSGPGGELIVFELVDASLAATSWELLSYNNGREAVVSVMAGTEITAAFGEDGEISGSAGCNRYTASWEVAGIEITIGPIAATERACLEPEGIMEQEMRYLTALSQATRYAVGIDSLDVFADDGARLLHFRRS